MNMLKKNKKVYVSKKNNRNDLWRYRIKKFFSFQEGSDKILTIAVFILVCFGTLMIVSTNVGRAFSYSSSIVLETLMKQVLFIVLSFICMRFFYTFFKFKTISSRFVQCILMVAMFVFVGLTLCFSAAGGSHAWIRLGSFSIQPAEFVKPFLIVLVAVSVYNALYNAKLRKDFNTVYKYPIVATVIFCIIVFLQNDIGTGAIILTVSLVCMTIPSFDEVAQKQSLIRNLILIFVVSCVLLFGVFHAENLFFSGSGFDHIATRIQNAKDPYQDVYGEGYQPANSLYGIASSNITGKGIGKSTRKYGYLTQADNDYILAVTIEETGIFGLGLIVICYCIIEYRLFYYAFKTRNIPYKIILTGTAIYFFMHFFLNVGGVACLIPLTGIPLLFVSSGGSSLMAAFISIGICQKCISHIQSEELRGKS